MLQANLKELWSEVDGRRARYVELSDRIWSYAELAYAEHRSAADIEAVLRAEGNCSEQRLSLSTVCSLLGREQSFR